jgi:hypothetical protein
MSGRPGQRIVAGDNGRLNRFGEGDIHGVVSRDVVAQSPRTTQQIEVRVPMEIEVREIRDRFVGPDGRDFTGPDETSEALNDFDVQEVRRVELVRVAKQAGLDSRAKRGLQEQFQEG